MILVTGATGNVGREVVKLLLASGEEVGAVTRDPGSAAVPAGAQVVGGDPSRPATLTSALPNVEAVLLSPRAVGHAAAEFLSLAGEHGARRVVLLSALTVQYPAGEARFADAFKAAEDVVTGCGLDWTLLRCADFAANALAWAPQTRQAARLAGPLRQAAGTVLRRRPAGAGPARAHLRPMGGRPRRRLPELNTTPSQPMERQMKLTIFAATGGIGRQILEQAVGAGHDITAVVRNPQKLPGVP